MRDPLIVDLAPMDLLTTELQACEREAPPSTEGRRAIVASRVMPHRALEAAIPLAQQLRTAGWDQALRHMRSLHRRSLRGKLTPRLTSPTEGLEAADMPLEALRLAADTLGAEVDTRLAATLEAEAAAAADVAAVVVMAADKACC